jgi:hypothetical protein
MPPVDPNEVMMTGEILHRCPAGTTQTLSDRASHCVSSGARGGGPRFLFLQSTLTDAKVKIYSDNHRGGAVLQKSNRVLLFPVRRHENPCPSSRPASRGRWALVDRHRVGVTADTEITLVLVRLHRAVSC